MSCEGWRYIYSSVRGTSHVKTHTPCQDSSVCEVMTADGGTQVLVAVVSDGAGSAQLSEIGSALACSLLMEEVRAPLEGGRSPHEITRSFMEEWLRHFQNEVSIRAEHEGLTPREFACTLLAAIVGEDCGVFFQIGDGAIVINDPDEPGRYTYMFWPQQGEYANVTYFATDEKASDLFEYSAVNKRLEEISLFTDGMQNLALHYESRAAHTPFFRPIFEWLRPAPEGHSEPFSSSLAAYLESPKVNDNTDDDKTLIFATRRLVEATTADDDAHVSSHENTDV